MDANCAADKQDYATGDISLCPKPRRHWASAPVKFAGAGTRVPWSDYPMASTNTCTSQLGRADAIILRKASQYETHVYTLSFRQLEEIMSERSLSVDHVTIWRWVQRYAPELNRRCRPELRNTNRSWRVDEMYCRVARKWTDLYRAVDSTGATIDFLLSAKRDAAAAKRFLQKALRSPGHPRPRVINVDRNPSYPKAISALRQTGDLGRGRRCRPLRYLNNITIEP